ncbi:hypothetical protein [Actinomadura sp. J1-007]|uniref:hypothetical protein n=1 Tax=Actinomadura sp. J1-007 TaxID=2661913 RepID=UPI0013713C58|nr:hypothetical protein [Actinomadura sp. J1-007]
MSIDSGATAVSAPRMTISASRRSRRVAEPDGAAAGSGAGRPGARACVLGASGLGGVG